MGGSLLAKDMLIPTVGWPEPIIPLSPSLQHPWIMAAPAPFDALQDDTTFPGLMATKSVASYANLSFSGVLVSIECSVM
jgi:hypothetical protein